MDRLTFTMPADDYDRVMTLLKAADDFPDDFAPGNSFWDNVNDYITEAMPELPGPASLMDIDRVVANGGEVTLMGTLDDADETEVLFVRGA